MSILVKIVIRDKVRYIYYNLIKISKIAKNSNIKNNLFITC